MPASPCRRLALTMRVDRAAAYPEWRDCLAHDWGRFIGASLPGTAWLALPNEGEQAAALLEAWGVDGLVLTGGNDIGEHPHKDATDLAALDFALARGLPVLGVCRGLQVMQHRFGGTLAKLDDRSHVAVRHAVVCAAGSLLNSAREPVRRTVNSFHAQAIRDGQLAAGLEAIARCEDGTVEAAQVRGSTAVGVMWHPEREGSPAGADLALMRTLFGHGRPA